MSDHDPKLLGWMAGFPPAENKLIRFSDGSFYEWPQLRWSFSHIEELVPTKNIWRGNGKCVPLEYDLRDFSDLQISTNDGQSLNWNEALAQTYTDGLLVLHRGEIVFENYFGASDPDTRHVIQSANKSLVGILAEILIFEQQLDADALIPTIVPELAKSAYSDASVQQVLDMLIGMEFHEDYLDPDSEIWRFHRATGMVPARPGTKLEVVADVLPNIKKQGRHGEAFAYREPNIFVLGWIVRRAGARDIASQLSERIWRHMGAEQDGYYMIDGSGAETSSGFTLRDFARFGELVRQCGKANDRQVIPTSVIDKIMRGGNKDQFAKAGLDTLPEWSYKSQWWIRHIDGRRCAVARGAHGQVLYVDQENEMVVARFGSAPQAPSVMIDNIFLPTLDAITERLN